MTTRGPLHIRHATIRDFRGIDALDLDFPEGDTARDGGALVLGGDNGFGKTTVLEALALGLGRGDLLPPDSAPLAEQVRFGCKDFCFLGEDATVDVMFIDDSDRNGQEVVLRRGELPSGVGTLADARARAVERGDVPVVLPIDRLSSGQLALFAFAEPLLFSENPPDLALIDEPERHLHVQWQRVIVSALHELSPATQLVVATHSLDLMQSVTSAELAYLLPRNDPRRKANGAPAALTS